MFELTGKRAVVTGAASGIGFAIAELFARQGAHVVVLDLDQSRADAAAATIAAASTQQPLSIACDVSSETSVTDAFAQVLLHHPRIDILVNCAGIAHIGTLASTTAHDLDRLYHVNVRGTYLCMRAALEPMLAQAHGIILNMASIAATSGLANRFAYSMTKGAVLAMTLSAAKDYLDHGIRCNAISPARIHTPFVDGYLKNNYAGREAEQMAVLAKAQPIGRMGTPAEVAALALYLCSDHASFLTGCDYPLDGGYFNLR